MHEISRWKYYASAQQVRHWSPLQHEHNKNNNTTRSVGRREACDRNGACSLDYVSSGPQRLPEQNQLVQDHGPLVRPLVSDILTTGAARQRLWLSGEALFSE